MLDRFRRHGHVLAVVLVLVSVSGCNSAPGPDPKPNESPPDPQVHVVYSGANSVPCGEGFNATFQLTVDRSVKDEKLTLSLRTEPKNETEPRTSEWTSLPAGNHSVTWHLRFPENTTTVYLIPQLAVSPIRPSQVFISTVHCTGV